VGLNGRVFGSRANPRSQCSVGSHKGKVDRRLCSLGPATMAHKHTLTQNTSFSGGRCFINSIRLSTGLLEMERSKPEPHRSQSFPPSRGIISSRKSRQAPVGTGLFSAPPTPLADEYEASHAIPEHGRRRDERICTKLNP